MSTPYKKRAPNSPSRQLLWELNQLAVANQQNFYAHLDRENDEQAETHKQALAEAAQRHEVVRQNAELARQQAQEQKQAQQKREDDERRNALEAERRRQELAQHRAEAQQLKHAEAHREELEKVQKEKEKIEAQQVAARKQKEAEDAQKLQKAGDLEKKKQAAAAAVAQAASEKAAASKAETGEAAASNSKAQATEPIKPRGNSPSRTPRPIPTPGSNISKDQQWELDHYIYIGIHRRLKQLRNGMTAKAASIPALKEELGKMRRAIKTSVGQLIAGKAGVNKAPLSAIIEVLKKALAIPSPQIAFNDYIAHVPAESSSLPLGPSLLIYLLNVFSKAVIAQWIDEAGVSPKRADAIGVIASHIFALENFHWEGFSLIDILLAKLHVTAPPLFGIYGPEDTMRGKERLGWWRTESRNKGNFISVQEHYVRMTGLGAGYAALTLRNYEKAKLVNPCPEVHYWEAIAKISSVPPASFTQTHFILLRGLISEKEERFIGFYGGNAIATIKAAVVDLPNICPTNVANKSLAGLRDVLARETRLFL